jgi:hypothetical protein
MRERQSRKVSESVILPEQQKRPADPALTGVAEPLEAGENRDLAVRLAQSELTRRATVRQSQSDEGRRAAGVWGSWETALKDDSRTGNRDLSQRIQDIRLNIDHKQPAQRPTARQVPSGVASVASAYKYPTVPRSKALEPNVSPGQIAIRDNNAERQPPPVLPPKEYIAPSRASFIDGSVSSEALDLPPRPSKVSPRPAAPPEITTF